MAKTLDIAQAQTQLARLMRRNQERVLVTKRGKPIGAIVSTRDLAKLEEVENREILKRARAIKKATKKYIPLEQAVREYEKKWGVDLKLPFAEKSYVRG